MKKVLKLGEVDPICEVNTPPNPSSLWMSKEIISHPPLLAEGKLLMSTVIYELLLVSAV